MSGELSSWLPAVAASAVMLGLGMRMRLLTPPQLRMRCGACRRLVRRGTVCPCARTKPE